MKKLKKIYLIVCVLKQNQINSLYFTDNSEYKQYCRCLKNIQNLKNSKILSQDDLESLHQQIHQQYSSIWDNDEETNAQSQIWKFKSINFLQELFTTTEQYIVNQFRHVNNLNLNLTIHYLDQISSKTKLKRVKICSGDNLYHCYLCKECLNFLNSNIDSKKAKSSLNT